MTWTGIRIRGMNLNNFETEEILWNSSQEKNTKRYLFENKEERLNGDSWIK